MPSKRLVIPSEHRQDGSPPLATVAVTNAHAPWRWAAVISLVLHGILIAAAVYWVVYAVRPAVEPMPEDTQPIQCLHFKSTGTEPAGENAGRVARPSAVAVSIPRQVDYALTAAAKVSLPVLELPDSMMPIPPLVDIVAEPVLSNRSRFLPATQNEAPARARANTSLKRKLVQPPQMVSCPAPDYPAVARSQGKEGIVAVRVVVRADGTVAETGLFRGCGEDVLDRAAVAAAKRWTFTPWRATEAPELYPVIVTVTFKQ